MIAGEESSKAAATNPRLTQTMIRIILDAIIRSSDVDYNGGRVRSRITTYSRLEDYELRKQLLPVLVGQGLISCQEEVPLQYNPCHASRMLDKNRAKATRTIYRVTSKGYDWLHQQEQQHKQSSNSNRVRLLILYDPNLPV